MADLTLSTSEKSIAQSFMYRNRQDKHNLSVHKSDRHTLVIPSNPPPPPNPHSLPRQAWCTKSLHAYMHLMALTVFGGSEAVHTMNVWLACAERPAFTTLL